MQRSFRTTPVLRRSKRLPVAMLLLSLAHAQPAGARPAARQSPAPSPTATAPVAQGNSESSNELQKALKAAIDVGDWQRAIVTLDRVLAITHDASTRGRLLRVRGQLLGKLDRNEEAVIAYRESAELAPEAPSVWINLCWHQILLGHTQAARSDCVKGAELAPADAAALANLGHSYFLDGDTDEAQKWYQRSLLRLADERVLRIKDEKQLEGTLADFDIFIRRGWRAEASRQARAWFQLEGTAWLLAFRHMSAGRYSAAEPLLKHALTISDEAYGPGHVYSGRLCMTIGHVYWVLGRPADSFLYYSRALRISDSPQGSDPALAADSLQYVVGALNRLSRYADALPLAARALSESELANGREHPKTALALIQITEILRNTGRRSEALPYGLRALAISEKSPGMAPEARAGILMQLGRTYYEMARNADAAPLLEKAVAVLTKERPNSIEAANARGLLVVLYQIMGRYADAVPLAAEALAIAEKALGPDHPDLVLHLSHLAEVYVDTDRYAEALPLQIRAVEMIEKNDGPESENTGSLLASLANLYGAMGRVRDALPLLIRSLAIAERVNGSGHNNTRAALTSLANAYASLGRHQEAVPLYLRAVEVSGRANGLEDPRTAESLVGLAVTYSNMRRDSDALPLLSRALAIREKNGNSEDTVRVLMRLAALYVRSGEKSKAEPLMLRSWRIAGVSGIPSLAAWTQDGLQQLYASSRPTLAVWYGKQAVNTIQAIRAMNGALDRDTQQTLLSQFDGAYQRLAGHLFAQGRLLEGQRVLAMLKESEYFDFIERDGPSDPRTSRAEDTERERPWTARYQTISSQLVALSKEYGEIQGINESVRTAQEKERLSKLDADLTVARQAFDAFSVDLMTELGQQSGQVASGARQREIGAKQLESLSALQGTLESLGQGSVILHYLMTDERLWILLTTPTIQLIRQAAIGEADLNRLIGQYRDAIASRDPKINEKGKALYDLLIGPVARDLEQANAETLMFSLDGSLRYLPMAALYDGEKYLTQRHRLAIYTEAAKANLKDPVKPQWRFAGFGLTEARANFSPLPSVRGELEGMVASGFLGDIKLNQHFTADSFKAGLAQRPPVVHIASHFVFKPGTESDSFLLLGDGAPLSLQAIKRGNYRFTDVDLVTLSACETAVGGGRDANGREVEGFGALVQNQGAKGVIATLWSVADESTGQFMQLFYGYRQGNPGMTKAEAMQKAQEAFIEGRVPLALTEVSRAAVKPPQTASKVGTDHPYFWAPFTLMGNWR